MGCLIFQGGGRGQAPCPVSYLCRINPSPPSSFSPFELRRSQGFRSATLKKGVGVTNTISLIGYSDLPPYITPLLTTWACPNLSNLILGAVRIGEGTNECRDTESMALGYDGAECLMLPITENRSFGLCLRHIGNPEAFSIGAEHLPALIPAFDFKKQGRCKWL